MHKGNLVFLFDVTMGFGEVYESLPQNIEIKRKEEKRCDIVVLLVRFLRCHSRGGLTVPL